MIRPRWNWQLEQWEVIDTTTREVTVLWGHEEQDRDFATCQAYCDKQNQIKERLSDNKNI